MAFPPSGGSAGSPGTFAGGLGDFLGGFNEESGSIRDKNQREQELVDARNQKVFETLANSDDPDIRAAAVTGLLTGNHPAKGMDKWFNKVQDHPIYDTIKGLVASGHQPFMDPVKRHGAELQADIDARMGAIRKSGMSPEDQRRAELGIFGAPPPRPYGLVPGTITLPDGTSTAGFADPNSGEFLDSNYQSVQGAKFTRGTGGGTGTSGHTTKTVKDANSPTGYSYVRYDDSMKEIGRTPNAPAPGAGETYDFIQTPEGIVRGGKKSGAITNAPGGEGLQKPEPPTADLASLRSIEASILKINPEPKPLAAGLSVSPEKMQAWRTAVDAEAKRYGYDDFATLQSAIGKAAGTVSAATPPPAPPSPRKTPPAKGPKAGALDVDAILRELGRNRAGGGTAPPR